MLRLGQVRYTSDDVGAAHALFEQALAEAGEDLAVQAACEQALAFTAMFGGDMHAALAHAQGSLQVAERLDDPGLVALALTSVAAQEFMCGNGLDRARIEHAVVLEESIVEAPVEWLPTYTYASLAFFSDELDLARDLYAGLFRSLFDRGDERALPAVLFSMSQLEGVSGNWGLATRYANDAVARSRRTGQAALCANALSAQASIRAYVGDADGARAAAAEGLEIALQAGARAPLVWITSTLGFLELSLGDAAAAHARLGPLSEMVIASGLAEPGVVRFLPDEVEALIRLGELGPAEQPLRLLEERGRALDRVSARAGAARGRALLHAARGDFDAARTSIDEALAQHARTVQPFELARTLLAQGQIERRAKRRGAARDALTQALELFDSLGAALWAERAAADLARIPGRSPGSGELTETQQRIVELVSRGLSNKEIAAQLFVTVRAVESNLSKVYAKLGVRSRTELASRAGARAEEP
jgi:DNA-binding CsgD family transcriptional regulator